MFETLFTYPAVLKRHRDEPLARERASYLEGLLSMAFLSSLYYLKLCGEDPPGEPPPASAGGTAHHITGLAT
jgi:hypothetical protein